MRQPTVEPSATPVKGAGVGQDLPGGYAGRILRVDLTSGRIWSHPWSPEEMRLYLGGAGLGAKILWDAVPAEAGWDHPENRLILATGPLAGLPLFAPFKQLLRAMGFKKDYLPWVGAAPAPSVVLASWAAILGDWSYWQSWY